MLKQLENIIEKSQRGFSIVELIVASGISIAGALVGTIVLLDATKSQVRSRTTAEAYSLSNAIETFVIRPQYSSHPNDDGCGSGGGPRRISFSGEVNFAQLEDPKDVGVPVTINIPGVGEVSRGYQIPNTRVRIRSLNAGQGTRIGFDTVTNTMLINVELSMIIEDMRSPGGNNYGINIGRKTLMFTPNSDMTAGTFAGCAIPNPQLAAESCARLGKVYANGICVDSHAGMADDPHDGCGEGRILIGKEVNAQTGEVTKNCVTYRQVCGENRFVEGFDDAGFVQCSAPVNPQVIVQVAPSATPPPPPTPTPTQPPAQTSLPKCTPIRIDPCQNSTGTCPLTYTYCPEPEVIAPTPEPPRTVATVPTPPPPKPEQPTGGHCTCGYNTITHGRFCGVCYRHPVDFYGQYAEIQYSAAYQCQNGRLVHISQSSQGSCNGDFVTW